MRVTLPENVGAGMVCRVGAKNVGVSTTTGTTGQVVSTQKDTAAMRTRTGLLMVSNKSDAANANGGKTRVNLARTVASGTA